jgi:fructose/tagatose bisphosphate aldolase
MELNDLLDEIGSCLTVRDGHVQITDRSRLVQDVHKLAEVSVIESGKKQGYARYLVRQAALELGVYPASIHELYMARGRGDLPATFTVPAMNLRALSYDAARAVFAAARKIDAGAFIFEIARSEMGYTDQRPAEYATNVLAAAIAEGYTGPVFIQGDHFQVSAKRYGSAPEAELQTIRDLIVEAMAAGFFNIDIDASTLVDLSKATIPEQQAVNTSLTSMFTAFIRKHEPKGITISVGGEIGEVGGRNSTEPELRAFMENYNQELAVQGTKPGMSKISIQTGTSHGGVVLPDGSIAQVSVDFDTLKQLSKIARADYGLGGAVQHGASTLPEEAFGKFVESEAIEVHLATNFMNMLYDRLPADLKQEIYRHLDEKSASDRKPDMTDEQFYYKTRKNALGVFKKQMWQMDSAKRDEVRDAWEQQFAMLFNLLGLKGTKKYVDQTIKAAAATPNLKFYLGEASGEEDVSDLAD